MKNKKPTVTIGIPAYNEERNIGRLLDSILMQDRKEFILKTVVVLNDASIDGTSFIVSKKSKKNKLIKLINGYHRKGKAERLNQLYDFNKSDILITLDADIYLGSYKEIDQVIKQFKKNQTLLMCSLRNIPLNQNGLVGKVSNSSFLLWQEAARIYKKGNNIHTTLGSAIAIKKELLDSFRYPKNTIADQGYLYIKANQQEENSYKYLNESVVYLKTVSTMKDYLSQGNRAVHTDKKNIADNLGEEYLLHYRIPFTVKVKAVIKRLIVDPFYTSLALFSSVLIHLFPLSTNTKKGVWDIAISSK